MKVNARRWNRKSIICLLFVLLVFYVYVTSGYHNYEIEVVINDTKPEAVWEYVSDFSKMRLLNPNILNFRILSDSGHTHDWRYVVEYTEKLTRWHNVKNKATAYFTVKKTMPDVQPPMYTIESIHKTCFFGGYCLKAESEFKFTAEGSKTLCVERIRYQCPPFLSSICHYEVDYQRKAVMHNLTVVFNKKLHNI